MKSKQIKYNQIPAIALEDVGHRMTKGYNKGHGDYRKRIETEDPQHWLDHAEWHLNQIKKGELYTGSGDPHAIAVICDMMIWHEAMLDRGEIKRRKK